MKSQAKSDQVLNSSNTTKLSPLPKTPMKASTITPHKTPGAVTSSSSSSSISGKTPQTAPRKQSTPSSVVHTSQPSTPSTMTLGGALSHSSPSQLQTPTLGMVHSTSLPAIRLPKYTVRANADTLLVGAAKTILLDSQPKKKDLAFDLLNETERQSLSSTGSKQLNASMLTNQTNLLQLAADAQANYTRLLTAAQEKALLIDLERKKKRTTKNFKPEPPPTSVAIEEEEREKHIPQINVHFDLFLM
jgi:hypothetical protein